MLEERKGLRFFSTDMQIPSLGVGFKRLQRRRRGLLYRRIVFLDCGQRFSQPLPHLGGSLAQHLEYLFTAIGLDLFAAQRVPGLAVQGVQPDGIMAAQAGDGACQHRLAAGALTNLAGHILSETVIIRAAHIRAAHVSKLLVHLLVGKDVEKRRLLQLHSQRLLERVVKNSFAGGVGEVRQHDAVFLGQSL